MTLPLDPEAVRLASSTTLGQSDGDPLIMMSEAVRGQWNGLNEVNGVVDYDRVCAVAFAVIDVGPGKALTLETPDSGAFLPRPDGVRIARWIGADDAATLFTAALALPDDKVDRVIGDFAHPGGNVVMFGAGSAGADAEADRMATFDLAEGTYEVRLCVEWRGMVTGADGKPHEVMLQALDLRRR